MSKRSPSLTKTATLEEGRRPFSFDHPLHAAAARMTAGKGLVVGIANEDGHE